MKEKRKSKKREAIGVQKGKKAFVSLISLLMIFMLILPVSISAKHKINESSTIEEVENEINKYMIIDGKDVRFDENKAIKDGQSEFILEIGKKINTINETYDSTDDEWQLSKLKLPIWGNWCGPGHGGGPAKDLLDYSCMMHDKDYAKYGYFDCGSDRRLINRIDAYYFQMKTTEKIAANAIKLYFKAQMKINGC